MLLTRKPKWIESGPLDWKSFPESETTVIRVKNGRRGGYQHIVELEWGLYGERCDAEELAVWLVFHLSGQRVLQEATK